MPANDGSSLYAQIRRRLIEGGEWEQIRNIMSTKLNETGWIDELHNKSSEVCKANESMTFQQLLTSVAPGAKNSVPLATKREITGLIRQALEKQFE